MNRRSETHLYQARVWIPDILRASTVVSYKHADDNAPQRCHSRTELQLCNSLDECSSSGWTRQFGSSYKWVQGSQGTEATAFGSHRTVRNEHCLRKGVTTCSVARKSAFSAQVLAASFASARPEHSCALVGAAPGSPRLACRSWELIWEQPTLQLLLWRVANPLSLPTLRVLALHLLL